MSAVSGAGGSSSAVSSTNPYEALNSGDFLRIMFAELTNQDPSKPADSKDLLDQIGTIRAIESNTALTTKMAEISRQNQITTAGSLIGKFVQGMTESGARTQGFVDSVSVTRLGAVLNLSSGLRVPMERLEEVIDPELIATAPPAQTPAATPPATTPPAAENPPASQTPPDEEG